MPRLPPPAIPSATFLRHPHRAATPMPNKTIATTLSIAPVTVACGAAAFDELVLIGGLFIETGEGCVAKSMNTEGAADATVTKRNEKLSGVSVELVAEADDGVEDPMEVVDDGKKELVVLGVAWAEERGMRDEKSTASANENCMVLGWRVE
ncbi:hypothetical protein MMC18_008719 [Xylographa bjoerkii]|nr:hypothetical protein [Xylographa bjoerkii]